MSTKKTPASSRSKGRITLNDVAKHAGVSPITASRALKSHIRVSDKLREKIFKAVDDLGYIPNQAARSLASAETKIISVIFPSLSNAVFPDVLDGIHDVLTPAGYRILLANSHYSDAQEEELVKTMLEQNPDGLIITGIDQSSATRKLLKDSRRPVVQLMELTDKPIHMNVGFSHFKASKALVTHLQRSGYQRIGFIGARMDPRSTRRLEGYKHAMADAGSLNDKYILTSKKHTSFKLGAELFSTLHKLAPELDVICFSNDDLAAGAIFECSRQGLKVPQDIAIAGFNNLSFAEELIPPLTTVSTPLYDMGKKAAQSLLDTIIKKELSAPVQVDTGFTIIDRASTRSINKDGSVQ